MAERNLEMTNWDCVENCGGLAIGLSHPPPSSYDQAIKSSLGVCPLHIRYLHRGNYPAFARHTRPFTAALLTSPVNGISRGLRQVGTCYLIITQAQSLHRYSTSS